MTIRKDELRVLKYVEKNVEKMIASSLGDHTTCGVFDSRAGFVAQFTEEQKRSVRVYVETWILEPLSVAINAIEGDRSYQNEEDLRMWSQT